MLVRQLDDLLICKRPHHAARSHSIAPASFAYSRPPTKREVEENMIGIDAVHLFKQVGKLRTHARIDLDDLDGVSRCVVHELDVEQAMIKTNVWYHLLCNGRHALLNCEGYSKRWNAMVPGNMRESTT